MRGPAPGPPSRPLRRRRARLADRLAALAVGVAVGLMGYYLAGTWLRREPLAPERGEPEG